MRTFRSRILLNILAISGVAGGCWLYGQRIAPLEKQEIEARAAIADLRERIRDGQASLDAIRDLQQQTENLPVELQRIHGDISADSELAWFPPRVKGHFAGFGVSVGDLRRISSIEEPKLPGYRRSSWTVSLPITGGNRKITALLLAIEGFESQERFVKVVDCVIQPDKEDPSQHTALLNLSTLVRE